MEFGWTGFKIVNWTCKLYASYTNYHFLLCIKFRFKEENSTNQETIEKIQDISDQYDSIPSLKYHHATGDIQSMEKL